MLRWFIFFTGWLLISVSSAQVFHLEEPPEAISMADSLQWERVKRQTDWPSYLNSFIDKTGLYRTTFSVTNSTQQLQQVVIFSAHFEVAKLIEEGRNRSPLYNGIFVPESVCAHPQMRFMFKVDVPPGVTKHFTLFQANTHKDVIHAPEYFLVPYQQFLESEVFSTELRKRGNAIFLIFIGAAGVLMLYTLLLFLQNRKEYLYLYYSGYLFFAIWYMLQKIAIAMPFSWLYPEWPVVGYILNEPLQFFIYILYNLFVVAILDLRLQMPRLTKFIYGLNWIYGTYALFDLLFAIITLDADYRDVAYVVTRILIVGVSLFVFVRVARKCTSPLVPYILTGTLLFILFSVAAMIFSLQPAWMEYVGIFAINFMQIGIFLEALFFSLALGYRIKIQNRERSRLHQAYVHQLEANQKMIEDANKELTRKVEERTRDIIAQTRKLEEVRANQLKGEYERKMLESDLNTLRLQMNPHFIFNSLNSIRYYILKQETPKAAEFIADFAHLLRMVLHHSKQTNIKLSEELEALQLYLQFEQERLHHKFTYTIQVESPIDPNVLAIQPLLIQPFVENAVWHGISPLDHNEGKVAVIIRDDDNDQHFEIIIDDNGVGRKVSAKNRTTTRKSYGLSIVAERLDVMNQVMQTRQGYSFIDKVDEAGNALGTRVVIRVAKRRYENDQTN